MSLKIFNSAWCLPTHTAMNIVFIRNPIESDLPGHWLPADIVKRVLEIRANSTGYTTVHKARGRLKQKLFVIQSTRKHKGVVSKQSAIPNIMVSSSKPSIKISVLYQNTKKPIAFTTNPTATVKKHQYKATKTVWTRTLAKSEPSNYETVKSVDNKNIHEDKTNLSAENVDLPIQRLTTEFKTKSVTSDLNHNDSDIVKSKTKIEKMKDAKIPNRNVTNSNKIYKPSTIQSPSATQSSPATESSATIATTTPLRLRHTTQSEFTTSSTTQLATMTNTTNTKTPSTKSTSKTQMAAVTETKTVNAASIKSLSTTLLVATARTTTKEISTAISPLTTPSTSQSPAATGKSTTTKSLSATQSLPTIKTIAAFKTQKSTTLLPATSQPSATINTAEHTKVFTSLKGGSLEDTPTTISKRPSITTTITRVEDTTVAHQLPHHFSGDPFY